MPRRSTGKEEGTPFVRRLRLYVFLTIAGVGVKSRRREPHHGSRLRDEQDHSTRSARPGSTPAARTAGMRLATMATVMSASATAAYVMGSVARTP